MTWIKGFNFRATIAYVTDGADETYVLGSTNQSPEPYPTTRNGVTFGYTDTDNGTLQDRDRDSTNDRRLAGGHRPDESGTHFLTIFRVDLPAIGDYIIRLALGDATTACGSGTLTYARIRDNGNVLATLSGTTSAAQRFLDATGVERTNLNWVANNLSITKTFTSTIFELVLGDGATSAVQWPVAHLYLEQVPAISPVLSWAPSMSVAGGPRDKAFPSG
jgi:hypothetical protein